MPPSFIKPVFPFLQITNLWAWTASQPDISGQSMAWRNPFLLYAAPLVSPIRAVRRNFPVSFHQPPTHSNPALIPQRQLCLIGFSDSCPPEEVLGTNMPKSWAKTPFGHFSSQHMLLQDHFLPGKEEMCWPQDKIDCCQDPERLFLISADRFKGVHRGVF